MVTPNFLFPIKNLIKIFLHTFWNIFATTTRGSVILFGKIFDGKNVFVHIKHFIRSKKK